MTDQSPIEIEAFDCWRYGVPATEERGGGDFYRKDGDTVSYFIEPQTREEVQGRLMSLKAEVVRLQSLLSDRDVRNANGSRMNDREWWVWKKRMTEEWQQRLVELRELKTWMSLNDKKLKRQIKSDFGAFEKACNDLRDAQKIMRAEAYAMRERLEELTAENNALHKRLQELELENTNIAPDHRREEWRQGDNFDQRRTVTK